MNMNGCGMEIARSKIAKTKTIIDGNAQFTCMYYEMIFFP